MRQEAQGHSTDGWQSSEILTRRCQPRLVPGSPGGAGLCGWPGRGEGGQFAGDVAGFGGADALEDLQGLLQEGRCLRGVADGQDTAAQAGQRVRLVPGAANPAGQV
jgi:hypothetical protein